MLFHALASAMANANGMPANRALIGMAGSRSAGPVLTRRVAHGEKDGAPCSRGGSLNGGKEGAPEAASSSFP